MDKYKKISFVKNSVVYSSTGVIAQFVTFVREFLVRRILQPEILGFWNFSNVVQGFISIFDFGCISGALRELPIMQGKNDQEEEARIRSTTLWATVMQNGVLSVFAAVYIYWNKTHYAPWEIIAAYIGILIFFFTSFQLAYTTFLTAAQEFVPLSKILFLSSVIEGISFPVCAYLRGLGGLMAVAVITTFLKNALFYLYAHKMKLYVRYEISRDTLRRLLSFGFVLRLVDYPNALFGMASILWVTNFMNIKYLALFSMARSFFLQISDITARIGTVYTMRFLTQSGGGVDRRIIASELKQFLLFQLLVVVPLLAWAAGVIVPYITNNFIPKYAASNKAFLILLICTFFYVLNSGLTNPWVMDKKLLERGIANTVGLIVMVFAISFTWFILRRKTIEDIALSTLAGYFLYFVYMVLAVGRHLWQPRESVHIIGSVTIAAIWIFVVLHRGYVSILGHTGFAENLKHTTFMAAWSFLAILPVPLYGLIKSKIVMRWVR
jgi:O-antigen/teichoic acid export membrane protein